MKKRRQYLLWPRKVVLAEIKPRSRICLQGCRQQEKIFIMFLIVLYNHFNISLLKQTNKYNKQPPKTSLMLKIKHGSLKKNRQGLQSVFNANEFVARRNLMLDLWFTFSIFRAICLFLSAASCHHPGQWKKGPFFCLAGKSLVCQALLAGSSPRAAATKERTAFTLPRDNYHTLWSHNSKNCTC